MSERDNEFGGCAGLKPIYCEGIAAARKIGADMHVIYYSRRATLKETDFEMVKSPRLYVVMPISAICDARKITDIELRTPHEEDEMRLLWKRLVQ